MVKEGFGMDLHSFLYCFESLCFQFKFNQICNRFCMPCILKCVILILYYFGNLLYGRVERIFREINNSISEGSLVITLSLKKLPVVLSRFTALTGLLVCVLLTMCTFNLMELILLGSMLFFFFW